MSYVKSLKELNNICFIVPEYQRGYRWQKEEVKKLLEDLEDFFNILEESNIDEYLYYSLQPVVVSKENNKYKIIDGQQRITTLYILFKYFQLKLCEEIIYKTREDNADYLNNLDEDSAKDNIDFYNMFMAFKTIKEYFVNKNKENFQKYMEEKIKIIWYEIDENEDELEVFERLNIGKIPLNDTELSKAMFLSKELSENDNILNNKAEIWYELEINLRENDDKLYCIYNNITQSDMMKITDDNYIINDKILRIEMYLKLLVDKNIINDDNNYREYFEQRFKNKQLNDDWDLLEDYKRYLENMGRYEQKKCLQEDLYHLIGYTITTKLCTIREIIEKFKEHSNSNNVIDFLYEKIKQDIDKLNEVITELTYGDKSKVFKILFLYDNILYAQEQDGNGFPYNKFKLSQYSIEHIHAQKVHSRDIHNKDEYFNQLIEFLEKEKNENNEFKGEIEGLINYIKRQIKKKNRSDEENNEICENIDKRIDALGILDQIGNLALLDIKTNNKLNNKTYREKKKWLHDNQIAITNFIPKNTQNIFYNNTQDEIWSYTKREEYVKNMHDEINVFLRGKNG